MRGIRRLAAVICAAVAMTAVCAFAKTDIPKHTDRFFVNDFADVLDSETEQYIYETGKAYNNNGGPQVVVLTMDTLGGNALEDFSIETARQWGIGDKEENNGVLILLVMDSRDIRIEVGYGLEGVLNDGKCGRFIRDAAPMLSDGDYSGGIRKIYEDVIGELENPTEDEDETEDGIAVEIITVVILIIFWLIIFNGRRRFRGGGWRGGPPRGGFGGGGFGNGGFGGGSSGGGFSGGGGSFGGGGASGKF